MTADVGRIESKLARIVAASNCRICAQRTSTCLGCGHPIGPLPAEVDHAKAMLSARLDRMHDRLARFPDGVIRPMPATTEST